MNSPNLAKVEHYSLSARDIAGVIFRHKLLICVTFLLILIGTSVGTYLMPNEYESRMKILVRNSRTDDPINRERTTALENDVSENQINSEIELLTSRDLLTQVVVECGLDKSEPSPLERLGLKDSVRSQQVQTEEAVNRLTKELTIEAVKKANIIEVKYSSKSPERAASVLKKLQSLYLDKHLKLHQSPGTYDFFKSQADQYEQQLRDAERQLSNFQQSMNVVSLSQQKDQSVLKLADAKSKLMETETFLREVGEKIDKVQQQLKTIPHRIVTQSKALPNQYSYERLNTMLVELQNRRTQLLTKFRADDRLVKEVDQQLRTTRSALQTAAKETATEQSTDLNPLRQALETELARDRVDQAGAQGRRQTMSLQVREYESQLSRLEGITAEYDDLTRKVKQSEETYQLYNKKQEEARIADELDQNKITNVSMAEIPVQPQLPSKPNRPLNFVLGLFFALLLSVGSVFAAEFFRETVNTPRELEVLTGQPVFASLPKDRGGRRSLILKSRGGDTVKGADQEWVSAE